MSKYCVTEEPDDNNRHTLHKKNCELVPSDFEGYEDIGAYQTVRDAMSAAEDKCDKVEPCENCC